MKITKVECIPLIFPYEEPIYDAIFKAAHRQALLVKVYTDEGVWGIGEAASFGGPLSSTVEVIEKELAPRIIGEDPFAVERIWRKCYYMSWQHGRGGIVICALSGIDLALWDIIGKATKTPLYKLLGGYSNKIRAYASGGFYKRGKGTKEIANEMKSYVDSGYTAVKMKVGRNRTAMNPLEVMPDPDFYYDVEEDLERVEAVRNAIGKKTRLLVDANAAWDLQTAMKMGKEFDKLGVYLMEEPVCTDDLHASKCLADNLDLKIAGYETEQLVFNFARMITDHCVDVVQPDLSWAGGITECRKIADLAYAYHKEFAPHCFSSGILLAASAHFLCAIPNSAMLEMDRNPNGLRTEIIYNPLMIDSEGLVNVSDAPGIGVELNENAIEKYRVK